MKIEDLCKKQRSKFDGFKSDQNQRLRQRSIQSPQSVQRSRRCLNRLDLALRKTAIKMIDGALMTRARTRHAGTDNPQPKAPVSLDNQHRLACPFALGLLQRQAELVGNLSPLRLGSQPGQHRIHLSDRQKSGGLRLRYKDHPVEPCHLHQKIFDRSQQGRQREGQTDTSVS